MPTRYGYDIPLMERAAMPASEAPPFVYFGGDPFTRTHPYGTTEPPETQLGFWGVTYKDKWLIAASDAPGSTLTWIANNVVEPVAEFLGAPQHRFVTLKAANLMREQMYGNQLGAQAAAGTINGWQALSNAGSPIQNVADIDKIIEFRDENFDASKAAAEFWKANPTLRQAFASAGVDERILLEARNRNHFNYLWRHVDTQARANQRTDAYNTQAPLIMNGLSKIVSAGMNYLAYDPAAQALLFPAAGAAVFGQIPAALGLQTKAAVLLANAAETAAVGAGWSFADQTESISNWNRMFDSPEWQKEFSFEAMGLSALLGVSLMGALHLGGAALGRLPVIREALTASHPAGSVTDPIALSFRNAVGQGAWDQAALTVQEKATALLGDTAGDLGWVLDPAILHAHNLDRLQVAAFLHHLHAGLEGLKPKSGAVWDAVTDFFAAGMAHGPAVEGVAAQEARAARTARVVGLRRAAQEAEEAELVRARPGVPAIIGTPIGLSDEARATNVQALLDHWDAVAKNRDLMGFEMKAVKTLRQMAADLRKRGVQRAVKAGVSAAEPELTLVSDVRAAKIRERLAQYAETARQRKLVPVEEEQVRNLQDKLKLVGEREMTEAEQAQVAQALERPDFTIEMYQERLAEAIKKVKATASPAPLIAPPIAAGVPGDVVRLQTVLDKWGKAPPQNDAKIQQALTEVADSFEMAHMNLSIQNFTVVAKMMRGAGLGQYFSRLVESFPTGTGQAHTIRSTFEVIRRLATELDNSKLTTDTVSVKPAVSRTATHVQWEMGRRWNEYADLMTRFSKAGKFGNSWMNPFEFNRAVRAFEAEASLHAHGQIVSTDPDVLEMVNLWRKHQDTIKQVGLKAGLLNEEGLTESYFPKRASQGILRANERKAQAGFTEWLLRKFETGDHKDAIHWDTLVNMKLAERVINPNRPGIVKGWRGIGRLQGTTNENLVTRKALGLIAPTMEAEYAAGLRSAVDGTGHTAMQQSARATIARLLGGDEIEVSADGKTTVRRSVPIPNTEFERNLTPDVMTDALTAPYMDHGFTSIVSDYLHGQGFRIMDTARHQQMWGIPKLTYLKTLDWAEARMLSFAQDSPEREAIKAGIEDLRRKHLLMSGRLPSIRDDVNSSYQALEQIAEGVTTMAYGAGIGQTTLSTETTISFWSRIYSLRDLYTKFRKAFNTLNPVTHDASARAELRHMATASQMNRNPAMNRFTNGAAYSDYHWGGPLPKILQGWEVFWDTFSGKTRPPSGGKWMAIPQALKAFGANQLQIGGLDYLTTLSRTLQVVGMTGETARFFPMAERMSAILQAEGGALDEAFNLSYAAAKAKGLSEMKAQNLAATAKAKVWRGFARKAGFTALGGDNWQVARRFAETDLFDPQHLAVLRRAADATGGMETGNRPFLDLNRLQEYARRTDLSPEELVAFDDAWNRLLNGIEQTMKKRVSDQNILQTPTTIQARTPIGKMLNIMSSYQRSWFGNNLIDMAFMPSRWAISALSTFMIGEMMNKTSRDLLKGKNINEIMDEALADPENYMLRRMLQPAMLGQLTTPASALIDSLTKNGRRMQYDTMESAGTSATNQAVNFGMDTLHVLSPLAEDTGGYGAQATHFANILIPGYKSWAWGLATGGLNAAGGPDLRPENRQGRYGSRAYRGKEPVPDVAPDERAILRQQAPPELDFLFKGH